MRKILFTLVFTFALVSFSSAQIPMRWGIKAGMNLSNLGGDADGDARVGFHFGAVGEYGVTALFSIQPELLFTLKGMKDWSAYYLELPINAKFDFALGSDKIYVLVGPYIGYGLFGDGPDDAKFFDVAKKIDFGAGIGAGYEFASGLFADLRYSHGLLNISDNSAVDINTMNFTVSVGYKF